MSTDFDQDLVATFGKAKVEKMGDDVKGLLRDFYNLAFRKGKRERDSVDQRLYVQIPPPIEATRSRKEDTMRVGTVTEFLKKVDESYK